MVKYLLVATFRYRVEPVGASILLFMFIKLNILKNYLLLVILSYGRLDAIMGILILVSAARNWSVLLQLRQDTIRLSKFLIPLFFPVWRVNCILGSSHYTNIEYSSFLLLIVVYDFILFIRSFDHLSVYDISHMCW